MAIYEPMLLSSLKGLQAWFLCYSQDVALASF